MGSLRSHELTSMAAIGSGGAVALSTLLTLGQSRDSSLSETLYRVAAAKFMSESSAGQYVGQRTAMYISWKRREGEDEPGKLAGVPVQPDQVDAVREAWERHGRPKIPDRARRVTASIIGKLGLATVHDMMSDVNAAARLHKRSKGMTWNEVEDDPDTNEKD